MLLNFRGLGYLPCIPFMIALAIICVFLFFFPFIGQMTTDRKQRKGPEYNMHHILVKSHQGTTQQSIFSAFLQLFHNHYMTLH